VLVLGFRLPIVDEEVTEDTGDFLRDLSLSVVTYKLVHGTMLSDNVHQGLRKISIRLDAKSVAILGMQTSVELSTHRSIIDCRNVAVDGIRSDRFVAPMHIECRKWSLVGVVECGQ
jgi:hypothetical protein